MKSINIKIADELYEKSLAYAEKHGTTLNEVVVQFLKKMVTGDNHSLSQKLKTLRSQIGVQTRNSSFTRDELYER